jgi:hypothetical protein
MIFMEATIKEGKLHLVAPISEAVSSTGKSTLIASTKGFTKTALKYKDHQVKINLVALFENEA